MTSIKRDATKQQWEQTEFPLVCETCLGDNPYLRMTSEPHGKKCKICEVPFTVFAWQAGTKGRWKRVEICKSCAQAKNVCQVCIYDLEFGLPVAVRDKVLREQGSSSSHNNVCSVVPQSDANRAWFNAQQQKLIANGEHGQQASTEAYAKLKSMARMEPRYERNLPKLCSFFAKGMCDRGSKCPFRHELPKDRNDPLSKQNTKDRFYGSNDPVARKMIWKNKQIEEQRKEAEGGGKASSSANSAEGDERAIATCYIRFDTKDESTVNTAITEQDVRDNFYSHGEIVSVRMHQAVGAFVEYTTSEAAELAIITMNQKSINGRKILVNWARTPKRGNQSQNYGNRMSSAQSPAGEQATQGPIMPKAPPAASSSSTTKTCLPAGFTPSAQVTAAIKARAMASSGLAKTATGSKISKLPRPNVGGGAIRRIGAGVSAAPKPYYPSADPNRLGTSAPKTTTT